MIFDSSEEKTFHKFVIFQQMMRGFGLDIVDQEMIERVRELTAIYQRKK